MIRTLRDFPSVEQLLQDQTLQDVITKIPRPIAANVIREVIAEGKQELRRTNQPISLDDFHQALRGRLQLRHRRQIAPVVNAAGILIHTNLGRAPLSESLFDHIKTTVTGYTNVEFDLADGKRGHRGAACEEYLSTLSGAEASTVVNNGAAALFLILNALANRRKVIISRGELVQIGGGFRIPDILTRSGARLYEVGSTNITTLDDYRAAANDGGALILKVHRSNFRQSGFTDEVSLDALVALGKETGVPVVNDLGSGVFAPTKQLLGYYEPTVQESVRAGADLTCFSGDKMLGGLQAGLIVGHHDLVTKVKKNPIFRTVRVDKMVFASLEYLLGCYLNGTHREEIGLWTLLGRSLKELEAQANQILTAAGTPPGVSIERTEVYLGGGALPQQALPSIGLVFSTDYSAERMLARFRAGDPPVIGRIEKDRFILEMKALEPRDIERVAAAINTHLARNE